LATAVSWCRVLSGGWGKGENQKGKGKDPREAKGLFGGKTTLEEKKAGDKITPSMKKKKGNTSSGEIENCSNKVPEQKKKKES